MNHKYPIFISPLHGIISHPPFGEWWLRLRMVREPPFAERPYLSYAIMPLHVPPQWLAAQVQYKAWAATYHDTFAPLLDLPFGKWVKLDLRAEHFAAAPRASETTALQAYIDAQVQNLGGAYGWGGYGEHRAFYDTSAYHTDAEPRDRHIGIDLWAPAGTIVRAPIAGRIHSVAYNGQPRDYGGTVILEHRIPSHGLTFYTLYGHLSRDAMNCVSTAQEITAGQAIGTLGTPAENGDWPPHLHFQVILEIGDYSGDFPGVVRASELDYWKMRCPNPRLLAHFPNAD